MLEQWSEEILNYIQQYVNHSPLLYIYIAGLVFLCFRGKDVRRMMVYPSLIIMVAILNPVCYGYIWVKFIMGVYWRMLWLIPMIPVIMCALLELAKIIDKVWVALIITAIFIVAMFKYGDNIYWQEGTYIKVDNEYKLPEISVQVGEKLLELEEEPVVVAPPSLYCYLRQYSGEINLVYGRNADWYIYVDWEKYYDTYELAGIVKANSGDTARLVELARNRNANLIVLPNNHGFAQLEELGFMKAAEVGDMVIYQWSGA